MGREWNWSGRSSKRGGRAKSQIPSGCMCAVFQAFDFHPFNFSLNHQHASFKSSSRSTQDHSVPKGAEAPRNSLESEDGTVSSISKEETFKIPKNIRIKTSRSTRTSFSDFSSEIGASSPGTKTPTLVARLMGLDLLPDANSSSFSSPCLSTPNNQQQGHRPKQQQIKIMKHRNSTGSSDNIGSLPRMSSARKSDVEHRLSLQINKENMVHGEDFEVPRLSFSRRKHDENNCRSPSHYARQIEKQVKDSVSRKVGLDITNTVKNREQGREDFVGQFKIKKLSKTSVNESSPGKHSNSSYSPRLSRFIDTKHKANPKPSSPATPKDQNTHQVVPKLPPSPPPVVNIEPQLSRVSTKQRPQEKELQNQETATKCKRNTQGKFSSRLNKPPQTSIRNKQEESFITRPPSATKANDIKTKSKKTHPLSSNLLNNLNTVKTCSSPQKQSQLCDEATDEAKRSTRLFSSPYQTYKEEATNTLIPRGGPTNKDQDKSNGPKTATTVDDHQEPEFQYISAVLNRTSLLTTTTASTLTIPHLQFHWFSPSHPLDPSLFHRLELYPPSENDKDGIFPAKHHLGPRCNRRLMFDLVDELLSEILGGRTCHRYYSEHGGVVLERVVKRVGSFPRAKCEVLEDIDGLIEMEEMKEEKEEEGLVAEIEGNIWETLVHETFTVMLADVAA